jgi:hypothetical protein
MFEFAVVAIRLIGLFLVATMIVPVIGMIDTIARIASADPVRIVSSQLFNGVILPIVVATTLIIGSRTIARWVTPDSASAATPSQSLSEGAIVRIGTLLMGLWLAVTAVIQVVALAPLTGLSEAINKVQVVHVSQILIGIGLMAASRWTQRKSSR